MKCYASAIILALISFYACGGATTPRNNDPYALEDTSGYTLTETLQGAGGVYMRTEIYTHKKDTSFTYVKVFNYNGKLAAVQFYKANKKHGPTLTFNDDGSRQLGTLYRNDTAVDMRPFK
jgi:antitoxin component YwqK of YwqJK toxin-antitoxin module